MQLNEIIPLLESIAPPELVEDFDKSRIGLVLDRAASVITNDGRWVHPIPLEVPTLKLFYPCPVSL